MKKEVQPIVNEGLLFSLALVMVQRPKASLEELAQAAGVSKSTLYRFCNTREQLVEKLLNYGDEVFKNAINTAGLETDPPLEALRRLTNNNLKYREIAVFCIYYWKPENEQNDTNWYERLDSFFLRGQQRGVFRIDIPAPALTEIWIGIFISLVDAERRGRVARAGLAELIEHSFLQGAAAQRRGDANSTKNQIEKGSSCSAPHRD